MTLSVVIPVYRGGHGLESLYDRICRVADCNKLQVIFVCDGCDITSLNIARKLKSIDSGTVELIDLKQNIGQQAATLMGLAKATGDLVVTIDDDLQHPPEHIVEMVRKIEGSGADVVYASFNDLSCGPFRRAGSKVARRLTMSFLRGIYPRYSSFRLMRSFVAERLAAIDERPLFIDIAIPSITDKITHTLCRHGKRVYGRSGYSNIKLIALWFSAYTNYRRRQRYENSI